MADLSKLMFEIGIKSLKDTIAAREKELDDFLRKYNGKSITLNLGDIKSQIESISSAMSGVGTGRDAAGLKEYQDELAKLNERFDKLISTIEKLNTKSSGGRKRSRKKELEEDAEAAKKAESAMGSLANVSKNLGFSLGSQGEGFEKASFSVKAYLDNIQKLIREEQVVGNYIKKAQDAIKFGEGHNRDTSEMKTYLQYLYQVQNAIQTILANRDQWKNFLGTSKALERPLPGSNNDIALLGAHYKNLKENVNLADASLRSLAASLRLSDDGAPNLRRNLEQIDVAITALNKEKEKLSKTAGRADEFGFSKESIERKKREIEAYIRTLEELKKNESLLKNTRLSALWTPENPGEKAPLGRYFLSLLGAGNEETQRVNELVNNKERIKKAFAELQESIQKLEQMRAKGLNLGLDISSSSSQVQAARDLLAQLSNAAYNEKALSNTNGINSLITQYQTFIEVLTRLRSIQSEANSKAVEKNRAEEKSIQDNNRSIEKAIAEYDKLSVSLERAKRLQKEASDQGIQTPGLDRIIAEMEHYLGLLAQLRTQTKLNDSVGTTVNTLTQEGAYRSLNVRLAENTRETKENIDAKNRLTMEERNMASALHQSTTSMRHQSQVLSDLKSLATQYIGVWGAQGFLQKIIQTGGQLESQRKSLTAILGQASYANDLYLKIQKLAVQSPFGVVQLDQYSKNLSAFGFQYNELFDMTKRLADIAAGTGTDFGRLALAIGHVRSEMALTGYTLRQFAMANVPMLQKLSENLGVTTSEIRKMVREKKVSYEDVVKVLKDLTDENGMFYNMQETMSEAVSAKFKNLKDSMDIMYGQMAESLIGDILKGVAKGLTEITKRWQSFGTVLVTTAAILGTYKLYMLAVNRGIEAQTASILANKVATQTLTAEQVKHLAVTGQITRADLVNAVATGKLSAAQAELAAEYFVVDKAMLKNVASMKRYQLAMSGVGGAGFISTLTNPWTAALIAAEAVLGTVMAYKQWSDGIYQDVETYLERTKTASQEINKYLSTASKPEDERNLESEIEQMRTILKNSQLYTDELQKQVDLAPNLSAEYDVLIAKMKEVNEQIAKSGVNAEAVAEIIKSSRADFGGWDWAKLLSFGFWDVAEGDNSWDRFLEWATNDDLNTNVEDMQKSVDALRRVISGMSEYRQTMESAIKTMIDVFGYTSLSNLPFEEQIQLLASDKAAWAEFTSVMAMSSTEFLKESDKLRDAARVVGEDWMELAEDDVPKMMEKMQKEFGFENRAEEFKLWASQNEKIFSGMLDIMLTKANERSPQIAQKIRDAILGWINGVAPEQKQESMEDRADRHLKDVLSRRNAIRRKYGREGEYAKSTLNSYAKNKGLGDNFFGDSFVGEYFKAGQGYSSGFEAIQKAYKKTYDAIETAKKVNDQKTISNLTKTFNQLDTAMDAFGLNKKTSGLWPKNKNKNEQDEVAKEIRERVRIVKEAADSYQYWRKAVGEENAFAHVKDEFGEILGEENLNSDNVGKLRENLLKLRSELEQRPKSKPVLEGLKEIDKELAQLDRKDFEKTTEEFTSKVQIEIDSLTRAWEIFNNVRQATGDVELAVKLSGVDYEGGTRNLADSLREKIRNDFESIGATIDFDMNLSDEKIGDMIKGIVPAGSQQKIKGLVEEYKKWRDLQRDVIKNDLQTFSNLISDAESLREKLTKITDNYNEQIKALERLRNLGVGNGGISQEQYDLGVVNARNDRNLQIMRETINGVNWGDAFNGLGNVLQSSVRELYSQLSQTIKSEEFKTYNQTQQKAYLDLAKQLRDNGGTGGTSPFNLRAYNEIGVLAGKYKKAVNNLIASMTRYKDAQEEVTRLQEKIKNQKTTKEEKEAAKKLLQNAMKAVEDAKKEMDESQTDVNQSGNNLQEASDKASKGLNGFATVLGQITQGGASGLATGIYNMINAIKGGEKSIVSSLGEAAASTGEGWAAIVGAILSLIDQVGDKPVEFTEDFFEKVAVSVEKSLSKLPEIIVAAVGGIFNIVGSIFGGIAGWFGETYSADYSGYEKAKSSYESLVNVWDDLIDRKRTYLNENWGNESVQAGKEAMKLLKAEIEQTQELAKVRLGSGASWGSHSIGYRMWEGSYDYNGTNWQDVAPEISRNLGVRFRSMEDMLNMTSEQLIWIKENYSGLWAHMDGEFKEHLENIIKYNDDIEDIIDSIGEKLHGLTMDGLLDSYYSFVTSAEGANDVLADDLESKLKEAIVKGMIENLYADRIKELIKKSTELGQNDTYIDSNGNIRTHRRDSEGNILDKDVASEYTGEEYALLKQMANDIGDEAKATEEMLKAIYGWSDDDSSSSVGSSIKAIQEQTADLLAAYVNAIRADVSVNRAMIAQYFPAFLEAMTNNYNMIRNIEQNTAAIMRSNDTIAEKITSLEDMMSGLKNKAWKMPVA